MVRKRRVLVKICRGWRRRQIIMMIIIGLRILGNFSFLKKKLFFSYKKLSRKVINLPHESLKFSLHIFGAL
jgi:hypothetical protein